MNRRTFWGFTVPSVIVMLALMVFPLITTVWLGFQKLLLRDLNNPQWVGFDNYSDVLSDPEFWSAFRFTMVFVAIVVPVTMLMGLGVALLLDRVGRGRGIYMAALLLPFIVTPVVGSLVYKDLFERGGLISWLWEVITDDAFAVDASNVKWLIIIQSIWYIMPFAMITFFAGLQTLPEERVEAAAIDGANFLRNLWHVILPHLRVLILFVGLITIMDAYRVYDQVFVWTGNRFTDCPHLVGLQRSGGHGLRHRKAGEGQCHRGPQRDRHLRGADPILVAQLQGPDRGEDLTKVRRSTPLSRIGLHATMLVLVAWSILPFLWTFQTSIKFTRDVAAKKPVLWGYETTANAYRAFWAGRRRHQHVERLGLHPGGGACLPHLGPDRPTGSGTDGRGSPPRSA